MKKKNDNKERNHYYIQWGIITFILMLYIVGTLHIYNRDMKNISTDRVIEKIGKQAIQIKGFYEGNITSVQATTKSIADFCSKQKDIYSEPVMECIKSFAQNSGYKNIYIVKPDGSAIDKDGAKYSRVDDSKEYGELLSGEEYIYIKKYEDGEITAMLSSPIADCGTLKGNVITEFNPSRMKDIVDVPIYSYMIVYKNGLVVEKLGEYGEFNEGTNLLDDIEGATFSESSYSALSNALSSGRGVNVRVQDKDGNDYYLIAQPISNVKCDIVIQVKAKQIERNATEDNADTRNLVTKLIIALCVFITLLAVIYGLNRIAIKKTSKELQNKAETDLLTGLLNKISTENKIKDYLENEGKDKTCMMCVLDIDNFKKINDTMGHAFGDEVLASLGRQISAEFRVSDIIGRMGGDEFIIFLKDLKDDEIISKEAARVERFFKNFTVGEYTKYAATASIGAALYPRDAKDFENLYRAADTALYKSKNRGKNQMSFYKEDNK